MKQELAASVRAFLAANQTFSSNGAAPLGQQPAPKPSRQACASSGYGTYNCASLRLLAANISYPAMGQRLLASNLRLSPAGKLDFRM